MESIDTLLANKDFLLGAYGLTDMVWVLVALSIFDVIMKGIALWRAARLKLQWWFIALLIVNSVGVLPIIFIVLYQQKFAAITKESR